MKEMIFRKFNRQALWVAAFLLFLPAIAGAWAPFHACGSLSAENSVENSQSRVLVVMMFDQHCTLWCGRVRPLMKELAEEFGQKVLIDEVDASRGKEKEAEEKCKQLGILGYYKDIESVPVVLLFDGKRKLLKELNGPKSKEFYRSAIEKVIK